MNRVSIKQLADALNVSKTTVSRSLNNQSSVSEATRKRVLELAREWGYVPRRVGASTRCIAIGFGKDSELLTRPGFPSAFSFDSAVIAGVLRGCTEQRYHPKLLSIDRDRSRHETLVQYMKRRGVEGVIMRSHAERPEIAERLADENFPCVLIASESQHPNMSYMRSDSFPDSLRAVEMLFELGHRDIALVIHTVLDRDHVERERAFREAFERR
ncbi:MAG: LacI family DNA-binding transcriptional regulator, partial [Planctomycetota bacterium]